MLTRFCAPPELSRRAFLIQPVEHTDPKRDFNVSALKSATYWRWLGFNERASKGTRTSTTHGAEYSSHFAATTSRETKHLLRTKPTRPYWI